MFCRINPLVFWFISKAVNLEQRLRTNYGLTQLKIYFFAGQFLAHTRILTRTRIRLELRHFLSKSTSVIKSESVDLLAECVFEGFPVEIRTELQACFIHNRVNITLLKGMNWQ